MKRTTANDAQKIDYDTVFSDDNPKEPIVNLLSDKSVAIFIKEEKGNRCVFLHPSGNVAKCITKIIPQKNLDDYSKKYGFTIHSPKLCEMSDCTFVGLPEKNDVPILVSNEVAKAMYNNFYYWNAPVFCLSNDDPTLDESQGDIITTNSLVAYVNLAQRSINHYYGFT